MYDLIVIKKPDGLISIREVTFSQLSKMLRGHDVPDEFWSYEAAVKTDNGTIKLVNPDGPTACNIYRSRQKGGHHA